ncbi:hypothetical protein MAHJHV59_49630 [Mycobacterium avium subsp. hominissuis]
MLVVAAAITYLAVRVDGEHVARARFVLAGVTPTVLAGLLGEHPAPAIPGAQVVRQDAGVGQRMAIRLARQRIRDLTRGGVTPEQAFAGTFHVNETWTQLDTAYARAAAAPCSP